MKKLILFLLYMASLYALYLWLKTPASQPVYLSPKAQILAPTAEQTPIAIMDIRKINARNAAIRSFTCTDLKITLHERITIQVSAKMFYEKDKNFRMIVNSFVKELDIGSNQTYFWFWSRRMSPSGLYYAKHGELQKTLLKRPFNPVWMMESLSMGNIDTTGAEIGQYQGKWAIFQPRTDAQGRKVTKMTLIDPQNLTIVGHYLFDSAGNLETSAEISAFAKIGEHLVPQKMSIRWIKEGVTMEWRLSNPRINEPINPQNWDMPQISPKINLGDYR